MSSVRRPPAFGRQVSAYGIAKLGTRLASVTAERAKEEAAGNALASAAAAVLGGRAAGGVSGSSHNVLRHAHTHTHATDGHGSEAAYSTEHTEDAHRDPSQLDARKAMAAAAAVARMKGKAERTHKGKYFLRMHPTEPDHPPVGLPLREVLQQIYNHRRDRTVRDLLVYMAYVFVFIAVVYGITSTDIAYATNATVYNIFLDQEMSAQWKKTFFDMNEVSDINNWMENVFAPGFYPPHDVSRPNDTVNNAYVMHYLRKLDGARIWLVRVSNTSCASFQTGQTYRERFSNSDGTCYGAIELGQKADTNPFGPPSNPNKYKYHSPLPSPIEGLAGWGERTYGSGGHVVYLPNDAERGLPMIQELVSDSFFDWRMRAAAIDFNLFNSETNQLVVTRIIIELLPSGLLLMSYKMYAMKMLLYESTLEKVRAAGEAVVAAGLVYYITAELRQLCRTKPWYKYFLDMGNTFDVSLQALMICCVFVWVLLLLAPERTSFSTNAICTATATATPNAYGPPTCFKDLLPHARGYVQALTLAGFLGLLMALKFFKYFSLSRRMNSLWLTLAHAGRALLAFTFGFGLLVAGFAFLAQMTFGATVPDFHTFESSFSTLLRYPLGDFDYNILSQARPDVAPIFFVLYMALVFLVCMNMVVAIITISFEEISKANQVEEKWKHAGRTLSMDVSQRAHRLLLYARKWLRVSTFVCEGCRSRRPLSRHISMDGGSESGFPRPRHGGGSQSASGLQTPTVTVRRPENQKLIHDSLESELAAYDAEQAYIALVGAFIQVAEAKSHRNLLKYMEEIYKSCPPGKNVYVGLNELCTLARSPDEPADPFCAVGHRWRALGAFVLSHARETNIDLEKLAAEESWVGRTCGLRVFRCWRNFKRTARSAWRCHCCARKPVESMPNRLRDRRRNEWTSNPLRTEHHDEHVDEPMPELHEAGGVDPDMVRASYKPRCIAWRLLEAYNAYKDVILLGATDRHAFISEKAMIAMGAGDKTDEQVASLNVKGSWIVTKINRSDVKQRRFISIKEEQPDYFVVHCHDMTGRLKRRFPVIQVVQLEASIPNPRRVFVYIEADTAALEVAGSDPLAKYAITADTLYDLVFTNVAERDAFINCINRTREVMMKAESLAAPLPSRSGQSTKASMRAGFFGARQASALSRAGGMMPGAPLPLSPSANPSFRGMRQGRSSSIGSAREILHARGQATDAIGVVAEHGDHMDDVRRSSLASSGGGDIVLRRAEDASSASASASAHTHTHVHVHRHADMEQASKAGSSRMLGRTTSNLHAAADDSASPIVRPVLAASAPSLTPSPTSAPGLAQSPASASPSTRVLAHARAAVSAPSTRHLFSSSHGVSAALAHTHTHTHVHAHAPGHAVGPFAGGSRMAALARRAVDANRSSAAASAEIP